MASYKMAETGYILQYGQPPQVVTSGTTKYLYDVGGVQLQAWTSDAVNGTRAVLPPSFQSVGSDTSLVFKGKGGPALGIFGTKTDSSGFQQVLAFSAIAPNNPVGGSFIQYEDKFEQGVTAGTFGAQTNVGSNFVNNIYGCTSYTGNLAAVTAQNVYRAGSAFNPATMFGLVGQNQFVSSGFGAGNACASAAGAALTAVLFSGGASGTVTLARGLWAKAVAQGSGVIGTCVGVDVDPSSLSSSTTNVGLRVYRPTSATSNFTVLLPDTSGSADGGITFGVTANACNLYRSGSNTLKSDTDVSARHWLTNSGTPTIAAFGGAGTGASISIAGTDSAFLVTLTTGTSPSGGGTTWIATFANTYGGNTPYCCLTPGNATAAALSGTSCPYMQTSASTCTMKSPSVPFAASTQYIWHVLIQQ